MDVNYYKKYEPIFGSWYIKRKIGSGSFGTVFEITREEWGETFSSALKIITIPSSKEDANHMMTSDGMTKEEVTKYYQGVVNDFSKECVLMSKLKGNTNIVSYEDHMIIPHEDGMGWDILIRMELLTPLLEYYKGEQLDETKVLKLGIDLCRALEVCKMNSIIHRDIKPDNIFVADSGSFKLGDFGVARIMESSSGASTQVGTQNYCAPEVVVGLQRYDSRADIYSLGVVMYRLLNNGRLPFMPQPPEPISFESREKAKELRLKGARFPKPVNGSRELVNVVMKACEYKPENRYNSASEMLEDLSPLLKLEEQESSRCQYVEHEDDDKTVILNATNDESSKESDDREDILKNNSDECDNKKSIYSQKNGRNRKNIIVGSIVGVLIICVAIWGINSQSKDSYHTESLTEKTTDEKEEIVDATACVLNIGDEVYFGAYQNENLQWKVIDVDGVNALLVCNNVIEQKPYDEKEEYNTWNQCSLRDWLNNEFYETTFDNNEQNAIIETQLVNTKNSDYGTDGGEDTSDKIFILSLDEIRLYFGEVESRVCPLSTYVTLKSTLPKSGLYYWWVRTPGRYSDEVACIDNDGWINSQGNFASYSDGGVRPALWVDTSILVEREQAALIDLESMITKANVTKSDKNYSDRYYQIKDYKVGEVVKFGMYDWIVLDKVDDKLLLLSRDLLECRPYNEEYVEVTWEQCDLREYLNAEFLNNAFSEVDIEHITETNVCTPDNLEYGCGTLGGNDTNDKIFLLSLNEVEKYLPDEKARITSLLGEEHAGWWWLRTPGVRNDCAVFVGPDGSFEIYGDEVYDDYPGVRPALWLDLS